MGICKILRVTHEQLEQQLEFLDINDTSGQVEGITQNKNIHAMSDVSTILL